VLRLRLFTGSVVEDLTVALGWNLLWRGHVMMFLRSEGNLLPQLAFQIKDNYCEKTALPIKSDDGVLMPRNKLRTL
jgi:hypothetical protein